MVRTKEGNHRGRFESRENVYMQRLRELEVNHSRVRKSGGTRRGDDQGGGRKVREGRQVMTTRGGRMAETQEAGVGGQGLFSRSSWSAKRT